MSDSMIEFLWAQLDEEAERAQAAGGAEWSLQEHEGDTVLIYSSHGEPVVYDEGWPTQPQARHIVDHSPARVLREVEAKRRAIGAHVADEKGHCRTCAHWGSDWVDGFKVDRLSYEGVRAPCLTLRLLALPYVDHPDYCEEWRP